MSTTPGRRHRRTMRNFFAAYGRGPWRCSYCDDVVEKIGRTTWDGNVHHIDSDVTNDAPENLAISHAICHQHQHPITDAMKHQISEKLRGRPSPTRGMKFPVEVNAKKGRPGASNAFYGKTHTEVSLRKMRRPRARAQCTGCGREYAVNWLTRHQCSTS